MGSVTQGCGKELRAEGPQAQRPNVGTGRRLGGREHVGSSRGRTFARFCGLDGVTGDTSEVM